MKTAVRLMAVCGLLLHVVKGAAQDLSNRGREFYVGYGHHQFMEPGGNNSQEMVLYFSAEEPANVTVTINGTSWVRTYSIPANTVIASEYLPKAGTDDCRLYSVPPSFGGTGGEGPFNRGIHIESDVPIVAYAHIFGSQSSGATMLMPVETWGYVYASMNSQQYYASNCFSWLYVVAREDNTVVEITPSVLTRNGRAPGVPFTATLNKGQIYQVVGASLTTTQGRELTGTRVKSIANASGACYPIAVFAGSSRTSISCPAGSGSSGDNIMQQIFPFQAWGKRYLTAPFSHLNSPSQFNGGIIRIAVKDPTTVVKRNGMVLGGIINNFYYEFTSNKAEYIEADKPVLVAQYMPTTNSCGYTGFGDPEMIYLSPVEQAIKRIGFFRNNREQITTTYLTLIIPEGGTGLSSLTIDGQPLSAIPATNLHTYPHPALAGYRVVVRKWTSSLPPAAPPGQTIVQSDSAFTAITYGLGNVESYGYNAGTLINNLSAVSSIHNTLDPTRPQHAFTCTNSPVELSVLMAYQPTKMVWQLSKLGSAITPNADVTVTAPASTGTTTINGVVYYKYTLPSSYQFSSSGTYPLSLLATHPSIENCNNTEALKVEIEVKEKPRASFSYVHTTGCSLDTVYLHAAPSTTDGYALTSFKWDFPGNTSATGKDTVHLFQPGAAQDIRLSVVTAEGCVSDTSGKITVFAPPVASLSAFPSPVCEGGTVPMTPSASYAGTTAINKYYWDFGNGVTTSVATPSQQTPTYANYGNYTVRLVAGISPTCVSDTLKSVVTISAHPRISIAFPAGCLPEDGQVQFINNSTLPDGQTITGHSWNFGDANATPANPNTSSAASPTHYYSAYGAYTIQYAATSNLGCVADTLITTTFNLAPKLNYAPLTAVCENAPAFSVASASVTNGVQGTGVYSGPGVQANGMLTPSVAGAGNHVITYRFTTTTGCVGTVSSTITLHPRPSASYTVANDACVNQNVTFTSTSTVSSGNIQTWYWDFGNSTTAVNSNGNPVSVTYAADNTYTIKLTTVSDQSCTSDPFLNTITIHPLPVAGFTVPTRICLPGPAAFVNSTTVRDNAALQYQWNFGDGGYATQKDPAHTYAAAGTYTVQLTATSTYGCSASSIRTVNDFYEKPVADFTVSPDELCQGANTVFTDRSSATGSSITGWNWNFGDGSAASTTTTPNKQFSNPGVFPVTLVVQNAAGCMSDPFQRTVTVHLQPKIDAGRSFVVPEGTLVQLEGKANSSTLVLSWSPATGLNDAGVLRPVLTATADRTYFLTATGDYGCTAMDSTTVKILRTVNTPNVFSPNGDGIHDRWLLPNLGDYPGATVEIFNRYGQQVFYSKGYNNSWDGKYKGADLPVGTYYYVIKLENGFRPLTGAVTLIR